MEFSHACERMGNASFLKRHSLLQENEGRNVTTGKSPVSGHYLFNLQRQGTLRQAGMETSGPKTFVNYREKEVHTSLRTKFVSSIN